MTKPLALAIIILVTTAAGTASARPGTGFISNEMGKYAYTAKRMWATPSDSMVSDPDDERCLRLVGLARDEGIQDDADLQDDEFEGHAKARLDGSRWVIKFRDAHMICEYYRHERKYQQMQYLFASLAASLTAEPSADIDENLVRVDAATCIDLVDRIAAKKLPDRAMKFGTLALRFTTAKQKLCEPLAKRASQFTTDVLALKQAAAAQAKREEDAALAEEQRKDAEREASNQHMLAEYRRLGITGDRRKLLLEGDWLFVGAGNRDLTLAQKAKASALYNAYHKNDLIIAVTKFGFKGNKLVSESTKTYSRLHYGIEDSRLYH